MSSSGTILTDVTSGWFAKRLAALLARAARRSASASMIWTVTASERSARAFSARLRNDNPPAAAMTTNAIKIAITQGIGHPAAHPFRLLWTFGRRHRLAGRLFG